MQLRGSQPEDSSEKRSFSLLDRLASGQVHRFPANSVLFREDEKTDSLFMLREGQVEVSIRAGSRTLFRRIAYPGFLLGVAAALSDHPHNYGATAIEAVLVSSITKAEFRSYLKENPQACFEVVQAIGTELMEIFESGLRPLRNKPRHLKPHV